MTRYLLGRLLQMLLVLLAMSAIVFGLMPGDPIDLMIQGDPEMKPADAARLRALYGLDQPIWSRYLSWLGEALSGRLGYSRLFTQPVLAVLAPRLLDTLMLMGLALSISAAIAIPAGLWVARRAQGWVDYAVNLLCFAGVSLPSFWLALLLITLFAVVLGWLPAGGVGEGAWQQARHLVMPVVVLSLSQLGHHIRFVRAAAIDALRADHVRTARAKGLSESQVMWRHVLRNAMAPVLTVLALSFGGLFSGALITETMFAWPGMGKAIYQAILDNDYNLALVGLLIATLATMLGNLLADLAYAWVDPRVSIEQSA